MSKMPRRRVFGSLVILMCTVLCLSREGAQKSFAAIPAPGAQVEMLPDAPSFALKTPNGKIVDLNEFKGQAVLLSFWATWCVPCKEEMPWLVKFQRQYGPQGLVVVGLSMDRSPLAVRKFLRQNPVNFPILMASQSLADQYFVKGLPTTIYLDANHRITDQVPGATTRGVMENEIKLALENAAVRKQ